MYGFDVSKMISAGKGDISQTSWTSFFEIIHMAECGPFYTVDLWVKYRTDSAPAPSITDHLVVMWEGQRLDCNAMLSGLYWLDHPVKCTIKNDAGNVMPGFPKTKWLKAGIGQDTDFFRDVSLPLGAYTVEWSVCGKQVSHGLTVKKGYKTTDIDITMVVTDTAGVDPYAVWDTIKEDVWKEMLVYETTVKLNKAEIDGKHLIIFHLEVTTPPEEGVGVVVTAWMIYLALMAAIAFLAVGLPSIQKILHDMYAYNLATLEYGYKECVGLLQPEWVACMIDKYPDDWDKMKDYIKFPEMPPDGEPGLLDYIMYIVLAVGAIAGVYIVVKYVMPALKGR